jgi:hypothetical protein
MAIQLLPPAPQDPTVTFDRYQFDGRLAKAVTAESGISFSDYQRMHVKKYVEAPCKKYRPQWVDSPEMFRKVLMLAAWRHCLNYTPLPENITLAKLKRMTAEQLRKKVTRFRTEYAAGTLALRDRKNLAREIAHLGKYGFLASRASVAYYSYRMRMPSPRIAEMVGLTASNVRVILMRLNECARALGFPCGAHHSNFGKRNGPNVTRSLPAPQVLINEYGTGPLTFREMAAKYGVQADTVRRAFTRAKRLADPGYPYRRGALLARQTRYGTREAGMEPARSQTYLLISNC